MTRRRPVRAELLKTRLDTLVETFDVSTIAPDPLQLVLRYDEPLDQEVAGLIAAAFAYGRADFIVTNIGAVLAKMTPSPFQYLAHFDRAEATRRFAGFAHRFHKTPDLVALFAAIADVLETHGSLGALFERCYDANDADIAPSLARFVESMRGKGLEYLLTSPNDGSACKRMNLYLRWMVRRTSPDLGLWTFVDPAKLVMPLDTHIHRIATFLRLNRRKSSDWKAARALTDALAKFDARDPVRYDFALCRLGILALCSRKLRRENCEVCLLNDVCAISLVR
ncbi:MAG: TIGR02757 family protein [Acidobacteria bacterium]|nr:TIGR02757 family protein [Acidobacteriota bacterium]MBV9475774.1 TIGR02757 family protein [Acidobacteriota bacterium]